MKKYLSAIISSLAFFGAAPAYADSLLADINMLHVLGSDGYVKVESYATVRFDLAANGTITGSMHQTVGPIKSLWFNAVITGDWQTKYPISNLTPANSWWNQSISGYMQDGFVCSDCGSDVSFTIGQPGDFTSAWQAFDPYNEQGNIFVIWAEQGIYQGTAMAIPEPAAYGLLLAGLGMLGFVAGRKRREHS